MNKLYSDSGEVSAEDFLQEPFSLQKEEIAAMLPVREERSNKGTCGKALLLAGCRNMAGAALLCGEAAYRTGCGLVMVGSPEANRIILQSMLPEALYVPVDRDRQRLYAYGAAAAGVGPGIGVSASARALLEQFLTVFTGKLVLDADALNLIAADLHGADEARAGKSRELTGGRDAVLTPHPGEMSRLLSCSIPEVLSDPVRAAVRLARGLRVICVLKDHHTVITDGTRVCINRTGCSGMSTGGSGDVLTGVITGLMAQGMAPFDAAAAGVWIHGRAGEAAARRLGMRGMLAGDIVSCLPEVFRELDEPLFS